MNEMIFLILTLIIIHACFDLTEEMRYRMNFTYLFFCLLSDCFHLYFIHEPTEVLRRLFCLAKFAINVPKYSFMYAKLRPLCIFSKQAISAVQIKLNKRHVQCESHAYAFKENRGKIPIKSHFVIAFLPIFDGNLINCRLILFAVYSQHKAPSDNKQILTLYLCETPQLWRM